LAEWAQTELPEKRRELRLEGDAGGQRLCYLVDVVLNWAALIDDDFQLAHSPERSAAELEV
jgi:hypothetical protein